MADVTVLQNGRSAFSSVSHGSIHHRSGQVVGANYPVGKQHPKCGIDRAHTRGNPAADNAFSASPLYRAKGIRLRPVGSAPLPLKKANVALGLLARSTRANSTV